MGDVPPPRTMRGAWVNVGVAAVLMVATFPGRSHGLGLFTNPILEDFQLEAVKYGHINLWASLLGALFCLPCGGLIDRFGTRPVLVVVLLALGATVLIMSAVHAVWALAVLILLTRGFGQSALSVVALGIVGKTSFRRRELAMAVFAILTGVGFAAAFPAIQAAEHNYGMGWREIWFCIGSLLLLGVLPTSWALLGEPDMREMPTSILVGESADFTLAAALRTPAFWATALTCALFGLFSSGTFLFYEDILGTFGFNRTEYQDVLAVSFLLGTVFNLACGWLARRWSMTRLLGTASFVMAGSIAALPFARTMDQLYVYAAAMGFVSGVMMVVFFIVWRPLFGATHLGAIQGAAQMLTVLASAVSLWLFPAAKAWAGSYVPLLNVLAAIAAALGAWVWFVRPTHRYTELSIAAVQKVSQ
jgi:MFS family permease